MKEVLKMKILKNVLFAISIAFLLWFFFSWLEIGMSSQIGERNFSDYNIFVMITNFSEK